jgi:hypothetical protein
MMADVTDWRKTGEALREFMQQRASQFVARTARQAVVVGELPPPASTMTFQAPVQHIDLEFIQAVEFLETRGNPLRLEKYLRSDRPLGSQERKILAGVLHHRYASKGGRSPDTLQRITATLACAFYETWRQLNKKTGIRDRGRAAEMKDYAARTMAQIYLPWKTEESFVEAVRDLMDRPKRRRDPGNVSLIAYQGKVALIAEGKVDWNAYPVADAALKYRRKS